MSKGAYGRPRCRYCDRVLTNREFIADLAEMVEDWSWSWEGSGPAETHQHTYDCEHEPRRKVTGGRIGEPQE